MATRTMTARGYLREIATVALYIVAAATLGTGLALVAEVDAQPLNLTREG